MSESLIQALLLFAEDQKKQSPLTVPVLKKSPVFDASTFENSIIAQLTNPDSKYSKDLEVITALFAEYIEQLKKLKEKLFQIEQNETARLTEAMLEEDFDYFADEAK